MKRKRVQCNPANAMARLKKRRKKKRILITSVKVSFILIGLFLIAYPFISDFVSSRTMESMIITEQNKVAELENEKINAMLKAAEDYNRALASSHVVLTDPFHSENINLMHDTYESLLALNESGGMMGYITIPCIDVKLPVFHGTSEAVLLKGTGHLEGTSLPIGGRDTHALLTGHTGVNHAKLFTDLIKMTKGDKFYVTILGRTIGYEVFEIQTVLPDETDALAIRKDMDLCTLVTCTPYGVNSHRLLVTGKRIEEINEMRETEAVIKARDSQWMNEYKKAICIGTAVITIILMTKLWMAAKGRRVNSEKKKSRKRNFINH